MAASQDTSIIRELSTQRLANCAQLLRMKQTELIRAKDDRDLCHRIIRAYQDQLDTQSARLDDAINRATAAGIQTLQYWSTDTRQEMDLKQNVQQAAHAVQDTENKLKRMAQSLQIKIRNVHVIGEMLEILTEDYEAAQGNLA